VSVSTDRVLILALVATALLTACDMEEDADRAITLTATLEIYADVAQTIAGERVSVRAIVPAGADPHTFEPSPRRVARAVDSHAIIGNGFGLEEAVLRTIRSAVPGDVEVIELAALAVERGVEPIGENPHLWLDPDAMAVYAMIIRDELATIDPDGRDAYFANFERYVAELNDLGAYMRATVAVVPEGRRRLVSSHDAFPYLARYLGFEVAAVAATSPGQEVTPQRISELTRTIRDLSLAAVFVEPQLGRERDVLTEAAQSAGARVCTLYSATLDDRVTTYVELMRFNADEIARCLGEEGT
jgi:manganese/iron transport system substrate-binding protein